MDDNFPRPRDSAHPDIAKIEFPWPVRANKRAAMLQSWQCRLTDTLRESTLVFTNTSKTGNQNACA